MAMSLVFSMLKTRMFPKTVFITGANRGIGLGIVKELLKVQEIDIIAAGARNVDGAKELQSLANSDSRLHLIPVDISKDESLINSVKEVDSLVGDRGLNLLINNAGILDNYRPLDPPKREIMLNMINVNAVSPMLAVQYFLPLLRKAASHTEGDELSINRAAIVNIGSDCSSQTLNVPGFNSETHLGYKMSKCAMLSFARTLAADFKLAKIPILVTTLHPGWVLTDMGGPNADITVKESTTHLVKSLGKMTEKHHGGLFDRHLEPLPF